MRFLIAADKFKDSLSSEEVSSAIVAGLKRADPESETLCCAVSDGGEGFLDAVQSAIGSAQRQTCDALDPLGRPIQTEFLFDPHSDTAYIELAAASGIELLSADERDPSKTSTFGTGLVIEAALLVGAQQVYIGIGGSATTDGGIGIAAALGYRFLDDAGVELRPRGGSLNSIRTITPTRADLSQVKFFVINDVDNPLFGPNGAAHIYGPQKGADDDMVSTLDAGLRNLDQCVQKSLAIDASELPGAGAAGGTGYGLHVFLGAQFCSGAGFVLELAGVARHLSENSFDWIITGEGQIDDQTCSGKLISEVIRLGRNASVPVVAFCGVNRLTSKSPNPLDLAEIISIHDPKIRTAAESIKHARRLLEEATFKWANHPNEP